MTGDGDAGNGTNDGADDDTNDDTNGGAGDDTDDGTDGGADDGAIPPERAFAVLADETRVAIVRSLAADGDEPVGFNDLRRRVGAKDSSGFNYHLRKLVGRFVRKTEAGYELTTAGRQIYGAILSGTYTDSVALDPIELTHEDDVCSECGGRLSATYEDEEMTVRCPDCEQVIAHSVLPPAAIEGRSTEALPEAFGDYLFTLVEHARAGFCSLCSGHMTGRLAMESITSSVVDDETPLAVYECERCFHKMRATPGATLVSHPAVVSFCHERGIDVRDVPPWRLEMLRPTATTVLSEAPLAVQVAVECDGDVLQVTVDESLAVTGVAWPGDEES